MAICRFLLFYALFFVTWYSNKTVVSEEKKVAYHVVEWNSLVPASTCLNSTKGSFGGLTIASIYGPCSPLGQEYSTLDSSKVLQNDQYRVGFINSLTSNKYTTAVQGEATRLPLIDGDIGGGNYVVTLGFGTPKRNFNLIFDTGSDVTWLKCEPCSAKCSDHYNPYASSTFSNTSGGDFPVRYGDGTYANVHFVCDNLTIPPSNVLPNFVFGCAQKYSKSDAFGSADGLLGVGKFGSFLSQTHTMYAKTFCHCLPSTDSSKGFVLFGHQALETCRTNKIVPLLSVSTGHNHPSYFVNLIGISIGNHRLPVSSYINSTPNTILDSGTVITRLPQKVYSDMRTEFKKFMSQCGSAPSEGVLHTCYYCEKKLRVPIMVLHFANSVNVNLEEKAVLWTQNSSKVCLAFAEKENQIDFTIIGNHQQRGLNVLYDIQGGKVGFGTGSCGK